MAKQRGGDIQTGVSVFLVMALVIVIFGLGVWVTFKYLVPSQADTPKSIGKIMLGELKHTEGSDRAEIEFTSQTECADCVAEFSTVVTYSDGQTKTVSGTAEPDARFVKIEFPRYDSTTPPKAVTLDVSAHLVDTEGKKGSTAKKTYSTMRS